VLDFGKPAGPLQRRIVTALVTRYYRAAAAEDGATACTLLLSSIARTSAESFGSGAGPRYLRGVTTCPQLMKRMFTHLHPQLTAEAAGLRVTHVRLKAKGGYAVLRFGALPEERELTVVHRNGSWWISSLLDSELF
jgi:hypothetical protein